MFDILFNVKKAERHPLEGVLIAFFYSSISILIASWIFPEYGSLVAVFFTVASCLYVTQAAIKREEIKEGKYQEKKLLFEHKKVLYLFLALFVGIVLSFAFWTYALPVEKTAELFHTQQVVLDGIRGQAVGSAIEQSGVFSIIINNNLKVLFISLFISLIYGAGAIFVLTWNASIMGFVIGSISKEYGIISFPTALLKYFLHGIPEMASYFIVILAGGIIYSAIVRGDFKKRDISKKIILDVLFLVVLAIILLIIAAGVEVWISSLI